MTQYVYQCYNYKGAKNKGKIEALSENEATLKLKFMGYYNIVIKNDKKNEINTTTLLAKIGLKAGKVKIKDAELAVFTKQTATLLEAGITLVSALDLLADQTVNPRFKSIIYNIRDAIEAGMALDIALEKHKDVFDSTYVSLIKAGSASGKLEVMMKKLSIYVEKTTKLKRQLIGALMYPAFILIVAGGLTTVMLVWVVPMIAGNFTESGKELPGLTQFVIDISNVLQENFMYIAGILISIVIFFTKWKKTPQGIEKFDAFLLQTPLFGALISKISIARFTSTMSILLASAIPLPEALTICAKSAGNYIIEKEIMTVESGVINGKSIFEMLQKSILFPAMVSGMIGVGEKSGRLESMLEKISLIYEEEVDIAMSVVMKMIEPILFVVIGGVVGFIMIAMYLPIFDLASTQGG